MFKFSALRFVMTNFIAVYFSFGAKNINQSFNSSLHFYFTKERKDLCLIRRIRVDRFITEVIASSKMVGEAT